MLIPSKEQRQKIHHQNSRCVQWYHRWNTRCSQHIKLFYLQKEQVVVWVQSPLPTRATSIVGQTHNPYRSSQSLICSRWKKLSQQWHRCFFTDITIFCYDEKLNYIVHRFNFWWRIFLVWRTVFFNYKTHLVIQNMLRIGNQYTVCSLQKNWRRLGRCSYFQNLQLKMNWRIIANNGQISYFC